MKFRSLAFTFILAACATFAFSQEWTWGLKAGGTWQQSEDDAAMAVDTEGNIMIAGHFQQDLSIGEFSLHTDDDYYADIFLCRIGADKRVQWIKHIEGGDNYGDDIALSVDDDKNIYLTGNIDGYMFVSKYDSTGGLIWHDDFDRAYYGYGTAIATDQFDNVYVTGGGGWNFFMAKLNYDGESLWVKDIWVNSSAGCRVTDIAVDAVGNIYFAGTFGIDELPLDDLKLQHDGHWGANAFWGKMDTDGNFVWAKKANGYFAENVQIALTSGNNLFLTGGASGASAFESFYVPGLCCQKMSPFIAKSDAEGTLIWAKPGGDNYYGGVPKDIQVDHAENLYLAGTFFTCYGTFCTQLDFYLEKYTSDGVNLWREEYAMGSNDHIQAIDLDNHGSLYALGHNEAKDFIEPDHWVAPRTYGVGQFDTKSITFKKTPRPVAGRLTWLCDGNPDPNALVLNAKGENVQWYSDRLLSHKLQDGNDFQPRVVKTDTFYVTQTYNGIESWPREVIVHIPDFPDLILTVKRDTLWAKHTDAFSRQWFYKGKPILNATADYIVVDTLSSYHDFSLTLYDGLCEKKFDQVITSLEGPRQLIVESYPNPTTSFTRITLKGTAVSSIRIMDVLGRQVDAGHAVVEDGFEIDLSGQKAGVYFIHLDSRSRRNSIRVIKK